MEQSARWNGGSFRFGQKLFSVNWPLSMVPNYFFQQHGTFVKLVRKVLRISRNHSAMSQRIFEYA